MKSKQNALTKKLEEYKEQIKSLISDGQLKSAKSKLIEYEKVAASDIDIYSMKAIILMTEDKLQESWFVLWEGLEKEPANIDLWFNMGYLCEVLGNFGEAARVYKKVLEITLEEDLKEDLTKRIVEIERENISNNKIESKPNILHGTMEIANQMNTISIGLNELGVKSNTLTYYPSYLKYSSDFVVDITKDPHSRETKSKLNRLINGLMDNYDIFHFHFGTSLSLDNTDLKILKESGKKLYMHHWGSDVRQFSIMSKYNPYLKVKTNDEFGMRKKLSYISDYVENAIVADYELYLNIREFYNKIHFVPTSIDLTKYAPLNNKNEKLLIVHAPTSPEIKGTDYIIAAIEQLQVFFDFEFKLIKGYSHEEAKSWYQKADLIIDQILVGSYGLLAVESMAMGKPVICWITDYMKENYPSELPIISANPDTLKGVLEAILKNPDILAEYGLKGRIYAERYHDMYKNAEKLLAIYDIN